MKIKSLEIYLFPMPIKESEITDFFLEAALRKQEMLKIVPVQQQTWARQQTKSEAFVATGYHNGQVGLGVKCSEQVATAIRGTIILTKLSLVAVRRGCCGNKISKPNTEPCKVTGLWLCASIPQACSPLQEAVADGWH